MEMGLLILESKKLGMHLSIKDCLQNVMLLIK